MSNVDEKVKKKRKVFGDDETLHLLEIWASDKIQKQFYSTTRHNLIYESIARQLKELGFISMYIRTYVHTCEEVKSKIRNLKTEYRSEKPKSGSSTPDWKHFSIIHKVLGQRDAANDDLMDESLADLEEHFDDANLSSQLGSSEDVEATEESPSQSIIQQSRSSLSPSVAKTANNSRIRRISRPYAEQTQRRIN
ncbi:uncharacterized protein LOC125501317 [Athalia rosae]|uniref:uncharacterized protein LOC125501317 n=1 Tax=Athalia rosae TaxID=37344 RepID=UPI00203331AB|nr:uncharacterized protein LOC125501317 [Athalia rosae]